MPPFAGYLDFGMHREAKSLDDPDLESLWTVSLD
jgi:hypothetical protein